MFKAIEGTEDTQELIKNIINNLRAQKPPTQHVDYTISIGKKISLTTEENDGICRNVSIIKLKGLHVAIGNKTGDLLVRKKPWLMSQSTILQKVTKFLEEIQPERLSTASKIDKDSFADSSFFGPKPKHIRITQTFQIGRTKIEQTILGSDSEAPGEFIEEYKTL